MAVLISGVRTEAQDIVRSSEAVVRSFSAYARARLRRQELLASRGRHSGETQRGDTTGKSCKIRKLSFIVGKLEKTTFVTY